MLASMIVVCIHATVTDLKSGVVKNKLLLVGFGLAAVLDPVYYSFFAADHFGAFVLNVIVMALLSVILYTAHMWAAGDSKLLIFAVCMIPARIYDSGANVAATVLILISIFSLAFLYYIGESVVLSLKEKSLFSWKRLKFDGRRMIVQYIKCSCTVTVANFLFAGLFYEFYTANTELFMIVNMLLVFAVCNADWLDRWYVLASLGALAAGVMMFRHWQLNTVNWLIYLLALIVVVLRLIAEKYNYKTIPTAEVTQGMVLSYATVLLFTNSRIKGLPMSTTEDIRGRISDEEAKSILRWEKSKYGQAQITIVRKIPFAIFITVGTIVFIFARMIVWV